MISLSLLFITLSLGSCYQAKNIKAPKKGKAVDSVVFDARNKLIHSYKSGDVTYQGMNLKADYMRVDMQTKDIFAHGYTDTVNLKEDKNLDGRLYFVEPKIILERVLRRYNFSFARVIPT